MRITRAGAVAVAVAMAVALVVAVAAVASDGSRHVRALDDCDPATFNDPVTGVGPGTCVGHGKTTFPDFLAQLHAKGSADGWAFKPGSMRIEQGQSIDVQNLGGEFHTFTEVAQFGGGCVPFLNKLLGLTAVPECSDPLAFATTGVGPGGTLNVSGLSVRVHRFQCLIHPWMHATVTVRSAENDDD